MSLLKQVISDSEETEYHKLRITTAHAIIEAHRLFNENYISSYHSNAYGTFTLFNLPGPCDIISDAIKLITNSFIMRSSKYRVEGLLADLKGQVSLALYSTYY